MLTFQFLGEGGDPATNDHAPSLEFMFLNSSVTPSLLLLGFL